MHAPFDNPTVHLRTLDFTSCAIVARGLREGAWVVSGGGGGYPASFGGNYAEEGGDCHLVAHRVMTRHGWRIRRVQVCS